jgi:glycosyltransferase involved in cell wall biosynthesis
MRLLFAHPALLTAGVHEGAIKAFRALIAALHGAGHECEVVSAPSDTAPSVESWSRICSIPSPDIERSPMRLALTAPLPLAEFRAGTGNAITRARRLVQMSIAFASVVRRRVAAFDPDWVVCENGTVDLRLMHALARGKLALNVATTASLPFGPRRATPWWRSSSAGHRRVRKVFCVSEYVRGYLRAHGGIEALFQPQVAYGRPPFVPCARFDGAITMLNPTLHKGGAIFAALAARLPDRAFRAIRSYSDVVPGLTRLPNVELVEAREDIDAVLEGTSVLVVPSMWGEGWGMVCIDAMLRGIPVLASDDGGLRESTLGVSPCIPTSPGQLRRRWNGDLDFHAPDVDPDRWEQALRALLLDRAAWQERSAASRTAALAYVEGLSIDPLCRYLEA